MFANTAVTCADGLVHATHPYHMQNSLYTIPCDGKLRCIYTLPRVVHITSVYYTHSLIITTPCPTRQRMCVVGMEGGGEGR